MVVTWRGTNLWEVSRHVGSCFTRKVQVAPQAHKYLRAALQAKGRGRESSTFIIRLTSGRSFFFLISLDVGGAAPQTLKLLSVLTRFRPAAREHEPPAQRRPGFVSLSALKKMRRKHEGVCGSSNIQRPLVF